MNVHEGYLSSQSLLAVVPATHSEGNIGDLFTTLGLNVEGTNLRTIYPAPYPRSIILVLLIVGFICM